MERRCLHSRLTPAAAALRGHPPSRGLETPATAETPTIFRSRPYLDRGRDRLPLGFIARPQVWSVLTSK